MYGQFPCQGVSVGDLTQEQAGAFARRGILYGVIGTALVGITLWLVFR